MHRRQGGSRDERSPAEGLNNEASCFRWGSVLGLQQGSCSEGPQQQHSSSSLPPPLAETLHRSSPSSRYRGKEKEKVRASILFASISSFEVFVRTAEGLHSVPAAEEPCSAWVTLNTLVNQSSHSYEEKLFKNPVLNLI